MAFNPGAVDVSVNNVILSSTGTYTTFSLTAVSTGTITSNGKTISSLTINNGTGTTTLTGALTMLVNTNLTSGKLNMAGFSLTTSSVLSNSASGVARSINGGGSPLATITVLVDWTVTNGTGFTGGIWTNTTNGYTINMINTGNKIFTGNGGYYGTVNQGGSGNLIFADSSRITNITATSMPSTILFTAGTTQTLNVLTLSGTLGSLVTLNSTTQGTQFNLSKSGSPVSTNYLSIRDSNATGGAVFYAGADSTNVSNNIGWVFTLPPAQPVNSQGFLLF